MLASHDGIGFVSEMVTTTLYAGSNWPKIHACDGQLWIDWIDADAEMTWIEQESPGIWSPVEIESFASPEERDFHVRGEIQSLATQ